MEVTRSPLQHVLSVALFALLGAAVLTTAFWTRPNIGWDHPLVVLAVADIKRPRQECSQHVIFSASCHLYQLYARLAAKDRPLEGKAARAFDKVLQRFDG